MSDPATEPPSLPAETGDETGFLTRWSRRKRAAEAGAPLPEPTPPAPPAEPAPPPVDLPDPATLSFDDDFTPYLGAHVPAELKRAALAQLFADPSFNRMDGLDVYIEDYNLAPTLSAEERDLLAHAREVLGTAEPVQPPTSPPQPKPVPLDAPSEPPGATEPIRASQPAVAASTTGGPSSPPIAGRPRGDTALLPRSGGGEAPRNPACALEDDESKAPLPPGEGLG